MTASPHSDIVLIAHNLRSCHNVGSLLRTAECLGVSQMVLSGYTPYPLYPPLSHLSESDDRLPHLAAKIDKQIHKTALGAESQIAWQHTTDILEVFEDLRRAGYMIAAIEQSAGSIPLPSFVVPGKIALLVGREVEGIESDILALVDITLEIPMFGHKESFNVVQAAAMGLYHCRFRI